jgi:hypothetical protein
LKLNNHKDFQYENFKFLDMVLQITFMLYEDSEDPVLKVLGISIYEHQNSGTTDGNTFRVISYKSQIHKKIKQFEVCCRTLSCSL